jgi:hypothetical protein
MVGKTRDRYRRIKFSQVKETLLEIWPSMESMLLSESYSLA